MLSYLNINLSSRKQKFEFILKIIIIKYDFLGQYL